MINDALKMTLETLEKGQKAETKVVEAKKTAKKAAKEKTTAKKAVATSKVAKRAETQAVKATADNVFFKEYSYNENGNVRSYVICGDGTKAIRHAIRSIPARYNPFLRDGGGWIIAAKSMDKALKTVAEAIITQK